MDPKLEEVLGALEPETPKSDPEVPEEESAPEGVAVETLVEPRAEDPKPEVPEGARLPSTGLELPKREEVPEEGGAAETPVDPKPEGVLEGGGLEAPSPNDPPKALEEEGVPEAPAADILADLRVDVLGVRWTLGAGADPNSPEVPGRAGLELPPNGQEVLVNDVEEASGTCGPWVFSFK